MLNFEIKTKISNYGGIVELIKSFGARREALLKQTDYYLEVGKYKKKIREINNDEIELISYEREETKERKDSRYQITRLTTKQKEVLLAQKTPICLIKKTRELWIYKNTRIHLDNVSDLGNFLELETVVNDRPTDQGLKEFQEVIDLLKIDPQKSIPFSYSDLMLKRA